MDQIAGNELNKDPHLFLLEWFAHHHAQPFTKASTLQRLPQNFRSLGWEVLPRLFGTVGLNSASKTVGLSKIDPMVLPCVVKLKNQNFAVLIRFLDGGKQVEVIFPQSEGISTSAPEVLPLSELNRAYAGEALFVTPDLDVTTRRRDNHAKKPEPITKGWFWKPIREHWSAWLQILVAAFAINLLGLALPIFVMNVYDRVIPNLAFVTLWTLAGGVVLALLLDLVLKLIRTHVLERAGRRIDLKLSSAVFSHAMRIKLLERQGGAATVASQVRDFEAVRDFFTSSSFVAVIDLFFIGIFVAVLWIIVGPIALVPLLAVPVVIVLALVAQVPIGSSIERMQQLSGKKHLVLTEALLGIETVKSVNGEPVMLREWENTIAAASSINVKTRFWSNFAISGTMLVQQSVSVIIIVWGVFLVAEGAITIGGLIAANLLAGRVLGPLANISQTLVRAQQALRSKRVTEDYMMLPSEVSSETQSSLRVTAGHISVKDVSLTYPGSQVAALENCSLEIKPGEAIGILGRVGSGKSTFGKLLVNLIQPTSGIVLIDGHEIAQYDTASLRDGIGYLPQDPDMFTGTIRENITLGKPNATEEELNRALYYSGMDYFISENPEGLDQFVGEKGNRLSGGQRQSISLARLLLCEPKVLFLDEPTNAMDHNTETTVANRLRELNRTGVGLVVSTHRQSLTHLFDRLIIMDRGKLMMDGKRDEVLAVLSGKKGKG